MFSRVMSADLGHLKLHFNFHFQTKNFCLFALSPRLSPTLLQSLSLPLSTQLVSSCSWCWPLRIPIAPTGSWASDRVPQWRQRRRQQLQRQLPPWGQATCAGTVLSTRHWLWRCPSRVHRLNCRHHRSMPVARRDCSSAPAWCAAAKAAPSLRHPCRPDATCGAT